MHKISVLLSVLLILLGWGLPVRAQAKAEADLYPADASGFPTISTFLDVFDPYGRFVSGLKPEQVTVLEDGQPIKPKALNEMTVPLQLVVAINPGPAFGVHDTQGAEYFDGIRQILTQWAQALPPDMPDDMSLVSIQGPIIAHASAKDWLVSLDTFQPDFHATTPNLQSLQVAIDTVSVRAPRVGMKRAVLFITPHMDDQDIVSQLQPLIQRAIQNRVRVFVWFADTDLYTSTASAQAFDQLAMSTGGQYYTPASATDAAKGAAGTYPDPEGYFAPLRRVYSLQYDSAARTGGEHTLSVDVRGQAGEVKSDEQKFSIDLQPPNPMFVSPPLQIVRQPPAEDPYNQKILLPDTQKIDVLVEFPDGHKRPLVRTTLYVDGQVVAENKAAPFDSFTWNLDGYKISGEHKIVVEAVDALNMSKTSMEIPVTVTVIEPPHGMAALFGRYQQPITAGAVALAGLVLGGILFMARFRGTLMAARAARKAQADPLTQPIPVALPRSNGKNGTTPHGRTATAKTTAPASEAPARLQRLISDPLAAPGETLKIAQAAPIFLTGQDMTFGTDPVQSLYVLDDPSLAPRHARITRTEEGQFLVADAGTIAGTWVNFEPVGKEGHALQHGDVVHFGQLIFRFELKDPPPQPEPKITKENTET